jgi:hypothetical protein
MMNGECWNRWGIIIHKSQGGSTEELQLLRMRYFEIYYRKLVHNAPTQERRGIAFPRWSVGTRITLCA